MEVCLTEDQRSRSRARASGNWTEVPNLAIDELICSVYEKTDSSRADAVIGRQAGEGKEVIDSMDGESSRGGEVELTSMSGGRSSGDLGTTIPKVLPR